MAYLAKQTFGGTMEHIPSVELNREEAMTLIRAQFPLPTARITAKAE